MSTSRRDRVQQAIDARALVAALGAGDTGVLEIPRGPRRNMPATATISSAANTFNPTIKSASSGLTGVTLKADLDWKSRVGSISRVA